MAQIARFRPVFYVFEAKREAQSAGHMLLTKRAARAQRGSRVHHPQGCIICAWLAIDRCIYIPINMFIYAQGGERGGGGERREERGGGGDNEYAPIGLKISGSKEHHLT